MALRNDWVKAIRLLDLHLVFLNIPGENNMSVQSE